MSIETKKGSTTQFNRNVDFEGIKAAVTVVRRQGLKLSLGETTRGTEGKRVFDAKIEVSGISEHDVANRIEVFDAGLDFEIHSRRAVRNAQRLK